MNRSFPRISSEYGEDDYLESEISMEQLGRSPGNMPTTPPPSYVPRRDVHTRLIDAVSIRNCLNRFTYIWQANGDEYWMFPVRISRTTVSGFRWSRRRWRFFGVSLRQIVSFICR